MWGWREHEGPRHRSREETAPVARQHSRGNSHKVGVHLGRGEEVWRGRVAVARELLLLVVKGIVGGVVRFIPVIEVVGIILLLQVLAGNFCWDILAGNF